MPSLVARQLGVTDVGGVEDRLDGEKRKRFEKRFLCRTESRFPQPASLLQKPVCLFQKGKLYLGFLIAGSRCPTRFVESVLEGREVGNRQLELDYLAIAHRVNGTHNVRDVGILEAAHDVHNGVGLADVGEKFVPESFAIRGSFDETRDVYELNDRRH